MVQRQESDWCRERIRRRMVLEVTNITEGLGDIIIFSQPRLERRKQ